MIFNQDNSDLIGAINDIQGQISAYVENGDKSTRAYAVGEFIIWKGDFYRVKTAITGSGVTFTPNTNIESKTIGEELKAKKYIIGNYNNSVISSTDGTPHSNSMVRLGYNDSDVLFHARVLLQNMTAGSRPTITITHNDFINCPSFQAYGNPVLRGQQGNYSDECYAWHSRGNNTIYISQNNFLSTSVTLLAGWGVYQIPGTVIT